MLTGRLFSFFLGLYLILNRGISCAETIVYLSQDRFVEATVDFEDGSTDRVSSDDFGRFDATVSAFGTASLTSELLSNSIFATGTVTGINGPPLGSRSGEGASHFSVDFIIPQDIEFNFDFMMRNVEFGSYHFTGPSFHFSDPAANFLRPVEIHETGQLLAGNYNLQVEITNGGAAEGILGEFSLQLTVVPEPRNVVTALVAFVAMGCFVRTI